MKLYKYLKSQMFIWPIIVSFLIIGLALDTPSNIINGLREIIVSDDYLVTDYFAIGGFGATFVNSALVMTILMVVMRISKMKVSGPTFAAIFLTGGFALFGKNVLNILPLIVGAFIYVKVRGISFKSVMVIAIYSTGLAPLVSFVWFGLNGVDLYYSIPLGISIGIIIGFICPLLSAQTFKFHNGYQLYNMGMTIGVIAFCIYPLFIRFGHTISVNLVLNNEYSTKLYIILAVISALFVLVGLIHGNIKDYLKMLKEPGRGTTNFHSIYGENLCMLNIGLLGFLCLGILFALGIQINGPIAGGVITVMAFGVNGKHIYNSAIVMTGIIIGVYIFNLKFTNEPSGIGIILALLFVTGLAPVAGQYGIIAGLLAGILHLSLVMNTSGTMGHLNLYNNGFAGGFIAFLFSNILDGLKE